MLPVDLMLLKKKSINNTLWRTRGIFQHILSWILHQFCHFFSHIHGELYFHIPENLIELMSVFKLTLVAVSGSSDRYRSDEILDVGTGTNR